MYVQYVLYVCKKIMEGVCLLNSIMKIVFSYTR